MYMVLHKKKLTALFKAHNVRVAYLFGSHASGYATPSSDIDIAVLLPDAQTKKNRFSLRLKIAQEIERIVNKPIDLVVLNDIASSLFRYSIVKEGQLLYEKNMIDRIVYESGVLDSYFDFEPFLTQYNEMYVKTRIQQNSLKG